ncbi:MAG: proline dehydrogenase family protein [Bacteriovoracaceae bacterium]
MNPYLGLPIVKEMSLGQTSWTLSYYEEWSEFLFKPQFQLNQKLIELITMLEATVDDFQMPYQVESVYFSLGFFKTEKKLKLISHRGAREQILLELFPNETKDLKAYFSSFLTLDPLKAPTTIKFVTQKYGLPEIFDESMELVSNRALLIADEIGRHVNGYRKSLFEKFSDFGLNLTAQYDLFRIHILKFLAILPSLDHDSSGKEVKRVLLENLRRLLSDHTEMSARKNKKRSELIPGSLIMGLRLARTLCALIPAYILANVVRYLVSIMAKRFIAGENIEKALLTLKTLKRTNRDATLDQLGELVVSEKEADAYFDEVIKIIQGIKHEITPGTKNASGINRAHVSIKVSALSPVFRPHAFDYTYSKVAPRLKKILLTAKAEQVFINIDAEHYHFRDLVLDIYGKVLLETSELNDYSQTGIVLQCYLRDATEHLNKILSLAKKRGLIMPIRLVKGAYWDAETIEAEAYGHEAPQFLNKEETDIHYRQLLYKVMSSYPHLQVTIASHNIHDHAWGEALREHIFPKTPVIEHQVLHMTYEALSHALALMNYPVRNYMPIGGLLVGMAYLVRRIMENSSQVGILTQMRKKVDIRQYQSPHILLQVKLKHGMIKRESHMVNFSTAFKNVQPVLLHQESERLYFNQAHQDFLNEIGQFSEGLELNGSQSFIESPFQPGLMLGYTNFANLEDAKKVVDQLSRPSLWKENAAYRISVLLKTASMMLLARARLAHLIVYESGKTFAEALGDVDEAIDFLQFYAREELRIKDLGLTHRNLVAVIAPWNFPLAIPCGMVAGALVAGNHVILKSAEQTPLIAWELVKLFHQSGVPKDVLAHLPGPGETIGKFLVLHSQVEAVVFTGSRAVGEWIYKTSLDKQVQQKLSYQPKVIAEMGGKNAIIVTANAELDETVSGILYASFAHAGQKCSAASRVIVDAIILEKLETRIREAVKDIQVGPSSDPATFVNTLISNDEKRRLQRQIIEATNEVKESHGKVIIDRSQEIFPGSIMAPAVFSIPTKLAFDRKSYACKELFGPVIHLIPYHSLEEAVKIFNCTEYALTGGVYSQSQDDIDYLTDKLYCGNLYINRPNTGARVGIEPFGGFKMSGTGPKAGSKEYVQIFHKQLIHDNSYSMTTGFHGGHELIKEDTSTAHTNSEIRLDQILRFLEVLVNNISLFSPTSQIIQRINSTQKWLEKTYKSWSTNGTENTGIPGQLSYNNFKLSKKEFIVLTDAELINEEVLAQVLAAMTVGTKVTILVRNAKTAEIWNIFTNLALMCHYEESKLRVLHLERESFLQFLHKTNAEVFYFDTELVDFELWYKMILSRKEQNFLPLILSNLEKNPGTHFENVLLNFVLVRSLAVNIMRHGAPLALENSEGSIL